MGCLLALPGLGGGLGGPLSLRNGLSFGVGIPPRTAGRGATWAAPGPKDTTQVY